MSVASEIKQAGADPINEQFLDSMDHLGEFRP